MKCEEVWISVTLLVGMKKIPSENNSREKGFILPLSWLVRSILVEKLRWPDGWLTTLYLRAHSSRVQSILAGRFKAKEPDRTVH